MKAWKISRALLAAGDTTIPDPATVVLHSDYIKRESDLILKINELEKDRANAIYRAKSAEEEAEDLGDRIMEMDERE